MVIRRIREHVTAHNWFAVGIDLAIVVAGVFIGTQATLWNEQRIEQEQSRSYRARLIEELEFNARQYRQQVAYYKQARAHGLATLRSLQSPTSAQGRDFLIDAYQTTQIDAVSAKRFIYDEMVSAGLVDRLGPANVQAAASDYYLILEDAERKLQENLPYRTIMRTIMAYPAQERIRHQCGDIAVYHRDRIIGVRLPDKCDVDLDPSLVAAAVSRIRSEASLVGELTRYLASLDEKLDALEYGLIGSKDLHALLLSTNQKT